jgi:hypothetical protein
MKREGWRVEQRARRLSSDAATAPSSAKLLSAVLFGIGLAVALTQAGNAPHFPGGTAAGRAIGAAQGPAPTCACLESNPNGTDDSESATQTGSYHFVWISGKVPASRTALRAIGVAMKNGVRSSPSSSPPLGSRAPPSS